MRTELVVETADGACRATLHTPDGASGSWPGVVQYPDAGGVRETFLAMADRLAARGYAVLLPDIYYRTPYAPFVVPDVFSDPDEFARLRELGATLPPDRVVRDAGAYLDALSARPEVADAPTGAVGYCFGGGMALRAAALDPARVAAAASIHGGNLAPADDPDSVASVVHRIRAAVLVAAATDDASFGPDQHDRLRAAFDDAGVSATIETYPAAHGFAVPDNPTHDDAADQRHRDAVADLFAAHLTR